MDFTREPVIETVITPREGYKIIVRSSKGIGQEEHYLDSVEVVSFGNSFFYRSNEKPKSFLAPVSDYEIVEVREARMVLKHVGSNEKSVKIGKEVSAKGQKKNQDSSDDEPKVEKKRERRSRSRRRRGREDKEETKNEAPKQEAVNDQPNKKQEQQPSGEDDLTGDVNKAAMLPPPPVLISDTISRYKGDEQFKGAFVEEGQNTEENAAPAQEGQEPQEVIDPSYDNLPPIPPENLVEQTEGAAEEQVAAAEPTEEVSNEKSQS